MLTVFLLSFVFVSSLSGQQASLNANFFRNPLLPSGPDPYTFWKKGYYYYTHTLGNRIELWKTSNMATLDKAERKVIWTAPSEKTNYSKEIWAPEVMYLEGKWYAYFSADDGDNDHHRIFILENENEDPMSDNWIFKGKLELPEDKWAIDGDIFSYQGQLYVLWSGWDDLHNGQQNIYIAALKDPLTATGDRVCISRPTFNWEKIDNNKGTIAPESQPHLYVNEGPQALLHKNDLFVVFSANACWTDFYELGLLRLVGNNPLDPKAWRKYPQPVFGRSAKNGVYAPGHNSFFKSPNGKEDWILYHGNSHPGDGCGDKRSPRMQPFTWRKDGTPDFGQPVSEKQALKMPSHR